MNTPPSKNASFSQGELKRSEYKIRIFAKFFPSFEIFFRVFEKNSKKTQFFFKKHLTYPPPIV